MSGQKWYEEDGCIYPESNGRGEEVGFHIGGFSIREKAQLRDSIQEQNPSMAIDEVMEIVNKRTGN